MRPNLLFTCFIAGALLAACGKNEQSKVASSAPAQPPDVPAAPVAPLPDVGKLEQVTVTSQGSGATAGVAVQEAMKMAILEVNGATIDTSSIAVKFGLDVTEGQTEAMLRGAAFAEAIAQRSRGTITGFKLLSMTDPTEKGGLYKVSIEASIAKFRAPEDSKKIKIVIARSVSIRVHLWWVRRMCRRRKWRQTFIRRSLMRLLRPGALASWTAISGRTSNKNSI